MYIFSFYWSKVYDSGKSSTSERGQHMDGWPLRDTSRALRSFPKANSVQAIQKSFGWDCKPRSPLCVRIQNDHTWWYTHGGFFRPFTLSLVLPVPELTGPQSSQPAASRHLSPDMNPKIMYDAYGFNFRLTVIFIAFYFNNSKLIPKALNVTTFTL